VNRRHKLPTYLRPRSPHGEQVTVNVCGLLPAGRRAGIAVLRCSIEARWMAACFCCTSSWASRCICSIVLGLFFSRRGTQLFYGGHTDGHRDKTRTRKHIAPSLILPKISGLFRDSKIFFRDIFITWLCLNSDKKTAAVNNRKAKKQVQTSKMHEDTYSLHTDTQIKWSSWHALTAWCGPTTVGFSWHIIHR